MSNADDRGNYTHRDRRHPTHDDHDLPDTCPTCGQTYEQVITTSGRYIGKPEDSQAVSIHVVRNVVEERGWDFGIFLHEKPVLNDVNFGDHDGR